MTPEQLAEIKVRTKAAMRLPITEACPVCGNPEATCKHGLKDAATDGFRHVWDCPECGRSAPFVGYDCLLCEAATNVLPADIPALIAEVERLRNSLAAIEARWRAASKDSCFRRHYRDIMSECADELLGLLSGVDERELQAEIDKAFEL